MTSNSHKYLAAECEAAGVKVGTSESETSERLNVETEMLYSGVEAQRDQGCGSRVTPCCIRGCLHERLRTLTETAIAFPNLWESVKVVQAPYKAAH